MSDNKASRKGKGRQKLEMVKIPNEGNLQVTFSKRRTGLFKKASELCTLCGAEIAIVVFSPGNKVFSFGHPCVETIVDRYLSGNLPETSGTMQLLEAHRDANVRGLNMQLTQILTESEVEKKRGEELDKMRKASQEQNWWEAPVDELSMPQLQQLKISMEELKKNVKKQAEKLMIQSSNPWQYFAAGSSSGGAGQINLPFDSQNRTASFNAENNMMIQSPNLPQFFEGSSSAAGGINLSFDGHQNDNNAGFNPNMIPHRGYNPGFGHGFF